MERKVLIFPSNVVLEISNQVRILGLCSGRENWLLAGFLFFTEVSRSFSAGLCKIHQRKASLDCRSFCREADDWQQLSDQGIGKVSTLDHPLHLSAVSLVHSSDACQYVWGMKGEGKAWNHYPNHIIQPGTSLWPISILLTASKALHEYVYSWPPNKARANSCVIYSQPFVSSSSVDSANARPCGSIVFTVLQYKSGLCSSNAQCSRLDCGCFCLCSSQNLFFCFWQSRDLDFINLLSFDFHGSWEKPLVTGHNSPLRKGQLDRQTSSYYNVVSLREKEWWVHWLWEELRTVQVI